MKYIRSVMKVLIVFIHLLLLVTICVKWAYPTPKFSLGSAFKGSVNAFTSGVKAVVPGTQSKTKDKDNVKNNIKTTTAPNDYTDPVSAALKAKKVQLVRILKAYREMQFLELEKNKSISYIGQNSPQNAALLKAKLGRFLVIPRKQSKQEGDKGKDITTALSSPDDTSDSNSSMNSSYIMPTAGAIESTQATYENETSHLAHQAQPFSEKIQYNDVGENISNPNVVSINNTVNDPPYNATMLREKLGRLLSIPKQQSKPKGIKHKEDYTNSLDEIDPTINALEAPAIRNTDKSITVAPKSNSGFEGRRLKAYKQNSQQNKAVEIKSVTNAYETVEASPVNALVVKAKVRRLLARQRDEAIRQTTA